MTALRRLIVVAATAVGLVAANASAAGAPGLPTTACRSRCRPLRRRGFDSRVDGVRR